MVPVTGDALGHGEAVSYVYDSDNPQRVSRLLWSQGPEQGEPVVSYTLYL